MFNDYSNDIQVCIKKNLRKICEFCAKFLHVLAPADLRRMRRKSAETSARSFRSIEFYKFNLKRNKFYFRRKLCGFSAEFARSAGKNCCVFFSRRSPRSHRLNLDFHFFTIAGNLSFSKFPEKVKPNKCSDRICKCIPDIT